MSYGLGGMLCLFTLVEVNYPLVSPQSQLAVFAGLGLVLCFLNWPLHRSLKPAAALTVLDIALALTAAACCAYVVIQTEPALSRFWIGGQSLGNRAGQEATLDTAVGIVGLVIVVEAARRSIGWALPLLSLAFLAYAAFGASLPDWLFPHRGYGITRIVSQTFLHSQGVFGTALRVMFVYVFLFVLLGAILRRTGATQFIIDLARRLFGHSPGGPAKVSVLSSGLMGSLSGSAVANTATTGTFTIPMMRSAGFKKEMAAGVEAAASSGGALVPPVMGAGAYMMLEIIDPPVTYLEIVRAALIPAILYYLSLFLIVHFLSRKIGLAEQSSEESGVTEKALRFEGAIFVIGIVGLVIFLLLGYSVHLAATISILLVLVVSSLHARTRLSPRKALESLARSAKDMVPLIAAAACVGIVIGVVTLTGVGTKLPTRILDLSQGNLISALILIMISSIVLGMGLPSSVCYLLMATLIGPVLSQLGVVPLAAHLFIFYFGMMSMVTPPVALAAYTAGSMAGASIMKTGFAAFRLALVGFTLPYMFVFRPQLLMLGPDGATAAAGGVLAATTAAVLGIVPFAAAIAGFLFNPLSRLSRAILFLSSLLLLFPARIAGSGWILDTLGAVIFLTVAIMNRRQ